MKILTIIPDREGGNGITHRSIKDFDKMWMIYYCINYARVICSDQDIWFSPDDGEAIRCIENYGSKVSFFRPSDLSKDMAGFYDGLYTCFDWVEVEAILCGGLFYRLFKYRSLAA